jgi:anti-sigma regulatory factor (Ser/Thr protein kinase)
MLSRLVTGHSRQVLNLRVGMNPLTVEGKMKSIDRLVDYVVAAAAKAGLNRKATYCLRLAVDEIATNIIMHGYQGTGSIGTLTVTAVFQPDQLIIELEDNSLPFDPRQVMPPKNLRHPLQKRKVGNLGIYLAMWGIDGFQYEHKQGINHSTFIMNRIAQKATK